MCKPELMEKRSRKIIMSCKVSLNKHEYQKQNEKIFLFLPFNVGQFIRPYRFG